jgi:endonuclease YncB( thermonuclease family)
MELLEYADKISRFSLYGLETFGKVVSIYDGDTFDLSFVVSLEKLSCDRPLSKKTKGVCCQCQKDSNQSILLRMKCRLDGLDARELKSEGGQKAKEILESFIQNKIVRVELGNNDKYGRLLVKVHIDINGEPKVLNEHLKCFKEYFVYYDGGKKTFLSEEN